MTVADDLRYNLENGLDRIEFAITKGEVSEVVYGLCSFHNLSFNPETGLPVNSTNIRILVSIQTLIEKGFDIYKKDDSISLKGYEVKFKTINEREITVKIKDTLPDYNKGTLSLICEFKRD
jgi:nitrite reductase/ring-hydroxylating ferredoxin subunit